MASGPATQINNIIPEEDLRAAPMDASHKEIVLHHCQRLAKILQQHDEATIGLYTNKQAAREQLARMTLIVRDYNTSSDASSPNSTKTRQKNNFSKLHNDIDSEDDENTIESMVTDIVEASFSIEGPQPTFSRPLFSTPYTYGRQQELAELMQALYAENADDVLELWNFARSKQTVNVVPDVRRPPLEEDLGERIDWNNVLFRSRSEDNLLYRRGAFDIEDPQIWRERLVNTKLEELDLVWPPVFCGPEEEIVGRQRERTRTNTRSRGR